IAKEHERRAAKLNNDFGGALLEALAGAKIEGNSGPAPVVDLQLEGDEGFGVGVRSHVGLAAVTNHRLAANGAGAVLAANHTGEHVFGTERLHSVQDFRLLVADFI